MGKLSSFASDEEAVEGGRWVIMRAPSGDEPAMRFCLRSMQSKKYRAELRKLQRAYKAQLIAGEGELKPDEQDEFDSVLAGRALVVAWEGVEDDNGVAIPFSQKAVQDALRTHALLRRLVYQMARNDDAFKPPAVVAGQRERLAGNSVRPSGTTND